MKSRKIIVIGLLLIATATAWTGGKHEVVETAPRFENGDSGIPVEIHVTPGPHYEHRMRILPLIRIKNNPQMAVWVEDSDGRFLQTLYVTERIGSQSWRKAPGDNTPKEEIRRPESLPVWAHRRGRVYADGLHLPTRENPMTDAISGATPSEGFTLLTDVPRGHDTLTIYLEVNMSTDFNDAYPADAAPGAAGYSGGESGSGQPALVYRGQIEPAGGGHTELRLIGHSSPDGSKGEIVDGLQGITTAREIIRKVEVYVNH